MRLLWRSGRVLVLCLCGSVLRAVALENSLVFNALKSTGRLGAGPSSTDIEDVDLPGQADAAPASMAGGLPCPARRPGLAPIVTSGNAGNLSHRGGSIAKLRDLLRVHVLIFDYPGYGKSEGRPSEQGCYRAADAAYAFLTDNRQIAPQKILLYGGSLGGGVAVDLAARKPHRGLVLVNTFTSAPDAGATMFPWLPVRWLMRTRFDNLTKIKSCTRPVFIGHGTADALIPFTQGKSLFEAANEPKQFFPLRQRQPQRPAAAGVFHRLACISPGPSLTKPVRMAWLRSFCYRPRYSKPSGRTSKRRTRQGRGNRRGR